MIFAHANIPPHSRFREDEDHELHGYMIAMELQHEQMHQHICGWMEIVRRRRIRGSDGEASGVRKLGRVIHDGVAAWYRSVVGRIYMCREAECKGLVFDAGEIFFGELTEKKLSAVSRIKRAISGKAVGGQPEKREMGWRRDHPGKAFSYSARDLPLREKFPLIPSARRGPRQAIPDERR